MMLPVEAKPVAANADVQQNDVGKHSIYNDI